MHDAAVGSPTLYLTSERAPTTGVDITGRDGYAWTLCMWIPVEHLVAVAADHCHRRGEIKKGDILCHSLGYSHVSCSLG